MVGMNPSRGVFCQPAKSAFFHIRNQTALDTCGWDKSGYMAPVRTTDIGHEMSPSGDKSAVNQIQLPCTPDQIDIKKISSAKAMQNQ
jgi:hypothetical protein